MPGDAEQIPGKAAAVPFLKWTGGKRWAAARMLDVAPDVFRRYYEPFLGGGAMFFLMRPWPATLSDVNEDLIETYTQVRDNVEDVIERLSALEISREVFLKLRSQKPRLAVTRAVRFIYLNRTAFNGIYRVNQNGRFNVPFGCKPGTVVCDTNALRQASNALQNRKLRVADFEPIINEAGDGDFVYADPPYTVKHDNNGFRRYNQVIFSWEDQVRLADCCKRAAERGAKIIVSNAHHSPLLALYKGFKIRQLTRQSLIAASNDARGKVTEVFLTN